MTRRLRVLCEDTAVLRAITELLKIDPETRAGLEEEFSHHEISDPCFDRLLKPSDIREGCVRALGCLLAKAEDAGVRHRILHLLRDMTNRALDQEEIHLQKALVRVLSRPARKLDETALNGLIQIEVHGQDDARRGAIKVLLPLLDDLQSGNTGGPLETEVVAWLTERTDKIVRMRGKSVFVAELCNHLKDENRDLPIYHSLRKLVEAQLPLRHPKHAVGRMETSVQQLNLRVSPAVVLHSGGPAMARSASLLLACAAAAAAAMLVGSLALSFVGASPAGLRAGQRAPSVEMQFFGGPPVTTTPPPPAGLSLGDVGGNNYVISMTILFFGSVLANANGFFAPWASSRALETPAGLQPVDHAVQAFTVRHPEVQELVNQMEGAGALRPWHGRVGAIGADGEFRARDGAEPPLWIGSAQQGMWSMSHWLASGQQLYQDEWVARLSRSDEGIWSLLSTKRKRIGQAGYSYVVMAHNGKCADRLIKTAPVQTAAHAPLRCKFTPRASPSSDRLELSSLWVCVLSVPRGAARFEGAFVEEHAVLSWISNNSAKYPQDAADPDREIWTLISTPRYGTDNKCPQESIPPDVRGKVSADMRAACGSLLAVDAGSLEVLHLQLWGAALPLNTCAQHFVHDSAARVGVCGDWLTAPSVEGALFSGLALAEGAARRPREHAGEALPGPGGLSRHVGVLGT
ncbi:unnamed protein product [Prorocentrum cordatum]|uniref:Uncharacterized protein n=1 Tax=Prorocentrum cordatum TaxID=2364126 RepID=A0ABN9X9P2_9DINO|nr:unnamed protein product [Polarella glacialis]